MGVFTNQLCSWHHSGRVLSIQIYAISKMAAAADEEGLILDEQELNGETSTS
jgi:hypothetical protein